MARRQPQELRNLLKQVSRSFYLTLRILPGAIQPQMGLAYLLARAADTIADTRLVSVKRRQTALHELRTAILSAAGDSRLSIPDLGELAASQPVPAGQGCPAERTLLEGIGKILNSLRQLAIQDRYRIRDVLDVITSGQELDLERFGSALPQQVIALANDDELDDYSFRVAGCVGEFWTRMCRAHLFPEAPLDDEFLLSRSMRFGKGLQLVNILRDLPADLRQGRCYIPRSRLAESRLQPKDLLDPAAMSTFRPIYHHYLQQAEEHLAAGWSYVQALPYGHMRVRLACAWPILIGIRTLAYLRTGNVLDERERIKVSRCEIQKLIALSAFYYPVSAAWIGLYDLAGKMESRRRN